jgi:hypothetical protein
MVSNRVKHPSDWSRLDESSSRGFRLVLSQIGGDGFEYLNPFRRYLWREPA